MKKLLIVALLVLTSFVSVQAKEDGQKQHELAMKHANPMPNLMRVAMEHKKDLNLTKEQVAALKAWADENKPKMKELIKTVNQEERMLHKEALNDDNDVVGKAQKMLDARKEIIVLKTKCRENLKTILDEKQFKHLVKIYKDSRKEEKAN
jgi:Spy/CpxP family protein refolding chaperone